MRFPGGVTRDGHLGEAQLLASKPPKQDLAPASQAASFLLK